MKISNSIKNIFLLGLFLSLVSCSAWKEAELSYSNSKFGYTVSLPKNWMRYQMESNPITISFDGPHLEKIDISVYGNVLKFKHTKKQLNLEMLPEELAELVEDDYKLNPAFTNFELIEIEPYSNGTHDGFRLTFKNRAIDGYKMQNIVTGFMIKKSLYLLTYNASEVYYYEQNIQAYQEAVKSFKVK